METNTEDLSENLSVAIVDEMDDVLNYEDNVEILKARLAVLTRIAKKCGKKNDILTALSIR